jgi:hypothetical protein
MVAPLECEAMLVPSRAREAVKLVPDTDVTNRISESMITRKLPVVGKFVLEVTEKVTGFELLFIDPVVVVWAAFAYCSYDIICPHP